MAKSEAIQDLFGWGRLGVNFNFVLGRPVEFFVREDAAEEARAIVKTLEDLPPADDASADESV
jgi:hypothetical protein